MCPQVFVTVPCPRHSAFLQVCYGVFPPVHKDTGGVLSFLRLQRLHEAGHLKMRLGFFVSDE